MTKEVWKSVIIGVLKVVKLVVDAILNKHSQQEATEKALNLFYEGSTK